MHYSNISYPNFFSLIIFYAAKIRLTKQLLFGISGQKFGDCAQ